MLLPFSGIARISNGNVYKAAQTMSGTKARIDDFKPFRLNVDYLAASDAPIKPLIEDLSFIRSKMHWGAAFRFGYLRVPEADFAKIAAAMGRDFAADFDAMAETT